jgi:hypothetical protein
LEKGESIRKGEDWERKDLERRLGRGEDKEKRPGMWYYRK